MPGVIDPETLYVDDLPGIWTPIQWELSEDERRKELEDQATASLLWAVDVPETILRLLLSECEIERTYDPPEGFDVESQGEWDSSLITFKFRRKIKLVGVKREPNHLSVEYDFGDFGSWIFEIGPERVVIERI
ncbi:MAG: hypothetical protein GTO14_04415 [Anaerolineales bacterium]|nr:hypothetical protein [Anaerolineales bacterium]